MDALVDTLQLLGSNVVIYEGRYDLTIEQLRLRNVRPFVCGDDYVLDLSLLQLDGTAKTIVGTVELQFGLTYTSCVASDLGKPVVYAGGTPADAGVLVSFDNTTKVWVISVTNFTYTWSDLATAIVITGGTGTGMLSSAGVDTTVTMTVRYDVEDASPLFTKHGVIVSATTGRFTITLVPTDVPGPEAITAYYDIQLCMAGVKETVLYGDIQFAGQFTR